MSPSVTLRSGLPGQHFSSVSFLFLLAVGFDYVAAFLRGLEELGPGIVVIWLGLAYIWNPSLGTLGMPELVLRLMAIVRAMQGLVRVIV